MPEQDGNNLFTLQQIIYAKLVKHMHGQYGSGKRYLSVPNDFGLPQRGAWSDMVQLWYMTKRMYEK